MLEAFFTQDILTQTRPRSALRQVPEDALSSTRCLFTCMGQVCFFVSKKESSDVSIRPWKMEAGGQGYAEEGSALPPTEKETQAHSHLSVTLSSRPLMGTPLARCSEWYLFCVTYLNHRIFYLKVYTRICNAR